MATKMNQSITEVVESMCDFVKRACKKGATPEEIAALPQVALAISKMTGYTRFETEG